MGKVFITGDIHGEHSITKFNNAVFPQGKDLTKEDYVIILGDFGLLWNPKESSKERYWLKWLNEKPWTTLFIDGNHENFDRLLAYSVEEWNGGKVSFIRDSIIYLHRGEIFNLCGQVFAAMGGANSHDIKGGILDIDDPDFKAKKKYLDDMYYRTYSGDYLYRINRISWWEQEVPNAVEKLNFVKNLEKYNYKVDYILSHEAPASDVILMGYWEKPTEYSQFLEDIRQNVDYKKWFYGHYHIDKVVNPYEMALYNKIERVI